MNVKTQSIATGLLAGAAVGAALALLYAPQRGRKTRRQIREFGRKTAHEVTEAGTRLRAKGNALVTRGRQTADQISERSRNLASNAAGELKAIGEKTGLANIRNAR